MSDDTPSLLQRVERLERELRDLTELSLELSEVQFVTMALIVSIAKQNPDMESAFTALLEKGRVGLLYSSSNPERFERAIDEFSKNVLKQIRASR